MGLAAMMGLAMVDRGFLAAWLPRAASTGASGIDGPFAGLYASAAFAVILVVGLALAFVLLFRRRDQSQRGAPAGRPNLLLLGLWTAAGALLAFFAVASGLPGFLDQTVAPYGAYQVAVTARQGKFDFQYPGGHIADTLYTAVGVPVQLTMTSADVVHGLSVPELRLSQAILPGRQTSAWFEATRADTFTLRSSISGGPDQAGMRTALVTLSEPDFQAWLLKVSDIFAGRTEAEAGELLYNRQGCKACHTVDGSRLVGPSFKNLYGYQFATREGTTITADDPYIKESILSPNASVIAGFEPVMTPFAGKLGDREIAAITAWLRTLSDRGGVEQAAGPGGPAAGTGGQEETR